MIHLPEAVQRLVQAVMISLCVACRVPVTQIGHDEPIRQIVYVSTNDGPIDVLALDVSHGTLTRLSRHDGGINPTYMAFSPDRRFAFAVNEADPPDSKVLSFAIRPEDGWLTPIGSIESAAPGAAHLAVHPSGEWLALPHYGRFSDDWVGGQTMILPIHLDGTLGAASAAQRGPSDLPCVNAHQAVFSASGDFLLVPCLGSDSVVQYKFDAGELQLNTPAVAQVAAGSGPRHLALSPDQQHAYLLTESTSQIVWFDFDAQNGILTQVGAVQSTARPIPAGKNGWSGHIVVHPSGRFLFVSNRLGLQDNGEEHGSENSIGVFQIGAQGEPTPLADGFVSEGVATPRDFCVDPTGRYLISANQAGDQSVRVFRIDSHTGRLTQTDALVLGGSPAFVYAVGAL